jgi:hypothetical protein
MTTPIQRLTRLLDEGAKFMVTLPGHAAIDLTPAVIAALDAHCSARQQLENERNLLATNALGRDVPTRVQFT